MPRTNPERSVVGGERNLASRIERERDHRQLSYEAVAKAMTEAGCPMQGSAIFKIEKASPPRRITVDELVAFAEIFETTVDDLLTPIEVLEKEWAQELIVELEETEAEFRKVTLTLLALFVALVEAAAIDAVRGDDDSETDMVNYILGHAYREGAAEDDNYLVGPRVALLASDMMDGDDEAHTALVQALVKSMAKMRLSLIKEAGKIVEHRVSGAATS